MAEEKRRSNVGRLSDFLWFDGAGYLAANPDVKGGVPGLRRTLAFAHWYVHGRNEGRVGMALSLYRRRKPPVALPTNRKLNLDRKSTRLNSSHVSESRMPSSA